jgi:plastocyanin
VAGRVVLRGRGGRAEPGAAGAVVWLPGVGRRTGRTGNPVMTSHRKAFEPHVIAVPEGTSVEFPNLDRIYHNAFSLSGNCKFDLGLYKSGASRAKVFDHAGVCRVYCNIHVQMAGIVLVTRGDASAVTGPDGAFRLDDLPPGRHLLRVWHEKGREVELPVEVVAGRTVTQEVSVDVAGYRQVSHTRKDGTPYDKDDTRY